MFLVPSLVIGAGAGGPRFDIVSGVRSAWRLKGTGSAGDAWWLTILAGDS